MDDSVEGSKMPGERWKPARAIKNTFALWVLVSVQRSCNSTSGSRNAHHYFDRYGPSSPFCRTQSKIGSSDTSGRHAPDPVRKNLTKRSVHFSIPARRSLGCDLFIYKYLWPMISQASIHAMIIIAPDRTPYFLQRFKFICAASFFFCVQGE